MRPDPAAPEAWDRVAAERDTLPSGWRQHSRDTHRALVQAWAGDLRGRWCKTDLFEERSADRALIPLGDACWVGVDVSSSVATQGRSRTRGAAVADVRRLPFRDASFDGVLSTSTLDHFTDARDIERSLREVHRVLRAGGTLVLTLDNPRNPLIRLRNALPYRIVRHTGLAPFFVGATLDAEAGTALLERVGFDVLDTTHVLHAPHVVGTRAARWSWWSRRALPFFDRLGTTRAAPWTGHFVAFHALRRA